jgi:hypothetical protein
MYHVELRQFPHNTCRFNLSEAELRPIVHPWVREQFVELGERKWSPHQARMTIIEGPELSPHQLAMGRGWRAAQRQGEDVTARVLAETARTLQVASARSVAQAAGSGASPPAGGGNVAGELGAALVDPLSVGVQMAGLLGPAAPALLEAWRAAAASSPGLAPSETLALAERELRGRGADAR